MTHLDVILKCKDTADQLRSQIKKLEGAVEALQQICDHKWESNINRYNGHTGEEYDSCVKCLKDK